MTQGASMDRVDSELVKRLSGKLTKDSHMTAQTRHLFPPNNKNRGEGGGPSDKYAVSIAY